MNTCQYCNILFEAKPIAKYCSSNCKSRAWYHKKKHDQSFRAKNVQTVHLTRQKFGERINAERRKRFKEDIDYRKRTRLQTAQSRIRKPQSDNNRQWRLSNPYKAMLKNLRKRGKRLVIDTDLELIFNRDNGTCQYCGSTSNLSLDHRTPVCRGGESSIENLCVACLTCNCSKGNKTPEEFAIYRQELSSC